MRVILTSVLITVSLFSQILPSAAKARIDIWWRLVTIEVSPQSKINISRQHESFILDGNHISFGNSKSIAHLGATGIGNNGYENYTLRTSVSENKIQIVTNFSGSIFTQSIATDGNKNCSANLQYTPFQGQQYIYTSRKNNGEPMIISAREADDIRCVIRTLP